MCVQLVDDDTTMITRALRVDVNYEGQGITREMRKYVGRMFKDSGLKWKTSTFGYPHVLEKARNENEHIVFYKVNTLF